MPATRHTLVPALLLVVFAGLSPAQATLTQTLPPGFAGLPGGSQSSWPFNTTNDQKWQWVFDTNLFTLQGAMIIQEISLRLADPAATSTGGSFGSVVVTLGSSPNDYLANPAPPMGQDPVFANNLAPGATVVRSGSWTSGPVAAGAWIPLGITPGFVYDPTLGQDFVIQIEKCGTAATFGSLFDMVSGPSVSLGANRYGHTSSCTATSRNNNANEAILVVRLDYAPLSATWQLNQPAATVSLDGMSSTGQGPVMALRAPGVTAPIAFSSSLSGMPFEIAVSTLPGVPLGGGAVSTGGGQLINLDLSDPNLVFFYAFTLSVPFNSFTADVSLPAPGTVSTQLAVLDPTQFNGFSLSALNTLVVQ